MQVLSTPVLGPLAKAAINTISPDTSPQEAALPIARLPFLGLPFPIPIPNLERLYIRCPVPRCKACSIASAVHGSGAQERMSVHLAEVSNNCLPSRGTLIYPCACAAKSHCCIAAA